MRIVEGIRSERFARSNVLLIEEPICTLEGADMMAHIEVREVLKLDDTAPSVVVDTATPAASQPTVSSAISPR